MSCPLFFILNFINDKVSMKYIFVTYILLVAVSLQAQNKKMVLESGRTYYVYTCPDAPKVVTHAADELSKYITQSFMCSTFCFIGST